MKYVFNVSEKGGVERNESETKGRHVRLRRLCCMNNNGKLQCVKKDKTLKI